MFCPLCWAASTAIGAVVAGPLLTELEETAIVGRDAEGMMGTVLTVGAAVRVRNRLRTVVAEFAGLSSRSVT